MLWSDREVWAGFPLPWVWSDQEVWAVFSLPWVWPDQEVWVALSLPWVWLRPGGLGGVLPALGVVAL